MASRLFYCPKPDFSDSNLVNLTSITIKKTLKTFSTFLRTLQFVVYSLQNNLKYSFSATRLSNNSPLILFQLKNKLKLPKNRQKFVKKPFLHIKQHRK